jgi:hypothetical protein
VNETALYGPVKALLEAQGYEVKGEVGAADVVGLRPGEDRPVIVELKTGFALTLFHQAIARQSLTDAVYVAVPHGSGKRWQRALKENTRLCRRLGLGLITVRLADAHLQVHLDPGQSAPRLSRPKRARLLKEFARRTGDPTSGGTDRSAPLITAYRQDALRLVAHLAERGTCKGADVARATGVAQATRMMRDDHYGWFERAGPRGTYRLSANGRAADHDPCQGS